MKFLLPQGIGDSVWALHKIQDVTRKHGKQHIEVFLNCYDDSENGVEVRALDFVRRFKFVDSANMLKGVDIHPSGEPRIDLEGRYVYIPDGPMQFEGEEYFALMPNGPLERGVRLENWLPEYQINWDIFKDFKIEQSEKDSAKNMLQGIGNYVTFYLGPMAGNTTSGHNRESRWTPENWIELGNKIHEQFGLDIVVVGAPYDFPYYRFFIEPELRDNDFWYCLIGQTGIGELYSVTTGGKFIISYQSGVGIVSSYLRVPTGIFWRAKGDSINPEHYLSFEEEMASAWARPDMIITQKHLPLIYGRHDPSYIVEQIEERGWA